METLSVGTYYRPEVETASRDELAQLQWDALRKLVRTLFSHNPFYQRKWESAGLTDWRDVDSFEAFKQLPIITRADLAKDQDDAPPYGTNLTFPLDHYTHWYRTSGSSGRPLRVLLTRDDWIAVGETWAYNFAGVGLRQGDPLYIAFGFGPYAGLWGAVSGAEMYGLLMIPGGGHRTLERIRFLLDLKPAALVCIPSYALRMAEAAREEGVDLRATGVHTLITGGEPGASIPATKARIEQAWGARNYDTIGLSEVGHHSFECTSQSGVHMIESGFITEVFDPETGEPTPEGEVGEMVLTALGRTGMPVVRYQTGDLVRLNTAPCSCGRTSARLVGGILSRTDGMITVRGINIFPTALEDFLLTFPEVREFLVEIYETRGMREIRIQIEIDAAPDSDAAKQAALRVAEDLRHRLALRADVAAVPAGSLPRPPGKARRFVHTVE